MKTLFVVVALLTYPKEQAVVFHNLYDNCKVAIHELKQKYEFENVVMKNKAKFVQNENAQTKREKTTVEKL